MVVITHGRVVRASQADNDQAEEDKQHAINT